MESQHRTIIKNNLDWLVRNTDLKKVCDGLLQKGVFNRRMVELFQNELRNESDRKKEMYLYVETRGPNAFSSLVETLVKTGHLAAARRLDPTYKPSAHLATPPPHFDKPTPFAGEDVNDDATSPPKRCHPYRLPQHMINANPNLAEPLILDNTFMMSLETDPLVIKVAPATKRLDRTTHPELPAYPMGSRPKGVVLIINNVQFHDSELHKARDGAEVDERNLEELFSQLGFKVLPPLRDLKKDDMVSVIKEFAKHEDLPHVCSLFVVMMSHGFGGPQNNSQIYGTDGDYVDTAWIIDQFNSINCPIMMMKPKIFIFQACEGKTFDFGIQLMGNRTQIDGSPSEPRFHVRSHSDVLVAFSTVPGYVSHRDKFLGAWFIQAICEVFMKYACKHHVEEMLKMVDNRLSQLMSEMGTIQTSRYFSQGFKLCYLNPGLYDAVVAEEASETLVAVDEEGGTTVEAVMASVHYAVANGHGIDAL